MGQLVHNQFSAFTVVLKVVVYFLIAILSWVAVSVVFSLVGIL